MRRLFIALVSAFTILAASVPIVQAANLLPNLMSSHDFYQAYPRQLPLAEQFSNIVASSASPLAVPQSKSINVALLLFGDSKSTKNRALLLSFKQRMRELRIDYRLTVYVDKSEFADDLDSYFEIVNLQPDYLVVTGFHRTSRQFVERFLHAGKPKVIFYDLATPLLHWMNHSPLIYIGSDQVKATKMLASYLDRQLLPNAIIAAFILPAGYLSHSRCDVFLDEMTKYNRPIKQINMITDNQKNAKQAATRLLRASSVDFIFSCSQNIANGVIAALEENKVFTGAQTNSWGGAVQDINNLQGQKLKASVLFMRDDLSIAIAEAIKLDMEGKGMPKLYVAHTSLMPAELDLESLHLMIQRAYRYSAVLWKE
ncbi:substrate-binding domain-containing protein [Marinomonas transparens]|uniref:Substrate-binding domain-containing protein n=1 Tax=Marinomonas transparens TaxID=2795388 RepID=A0A934N1B4_9GAMM|nr:substrate-binding domain-containing protein [Marinomonas transparens]MBJ7536513.1 substrate-binding domain-containing protein [Marinomonas transparens]